MIPPNAYVTLEHEYILVFRNGETSRSFPPGDDQRYEAAYFWEERNRWFTDLWTDVTGTLQALESDDHSGGDSDGRRDDDPSLTDLRERSAAYPLEIPYRLCNMYSAYGDTVLDPFWGTGTTSLAAMCAGRNSVGCELEDGFRDVFDERVGDLPALSRSIAEGRLERHRSFVERQRATADGTRLEYEADHYGVPVVTAMESGIRLYTVDSVQATEVGYRASHRPLESE